jgi:hypothetical protein
VGAPYEVFGYPTPLKEAAISVPLTGRRLERSRRPVAKVQAKHPGEGSSETPHDDERSAD